MSFRGTLHRKNGFTILEVLIALGITGIILAMVMASFASFSRSEALEASTAVVMAGLRDARAQTIASVGGNQYGVYIESDKFTLFQGAVYNSGAATNDITFLGSYVRASSSPSTYVFSRITGDVSASGTIDLFLLADTSIKRTIKVESTGLVNLQ